MRQALLPLLFGALAAAPAAAQTLLNETFDSDDNFTTSTPEFSDGSKSFFGRIPPLVIAPRAYDVSGLSAPYFAAQDLDGAGPSRDATVTFDALTVSGLPEVEVSLLIAEDDLGSSETWDGPDLFHVDYSLDGGPFLPLLWVEGSGGFNTAPFIDTDFDGEGDGTEITDEAQRFARTIETAGASDLVLRFSFDLNSADEDIAVDDFIVRDANAVLPVSLAAFTAEAQPAGAALAWTTASERDNAYFAVEVSEDGTDFREVARVDGAGTTDVPTDYAYVHTAARAGLHYFRLAQVDFDGAVTYSHVVSAVLGGLERERFADLTVSHGELTFGSDASGEVRIVDMRGASVLHTDITAGQNAISVETLARGVYLLTDGVSSVRFVR